MTSEWDLLLKPIMENNLEEFKTVIDAIEKSLDTVFANPDDDTSLIHFLGIVCSYPRPMRLSLSLNPLSPPVVPIDNTNCQHSSSPILLLYPH